MSFLRRMWGRAFAKRGADPWFCLPVGTAMVLDAVVSLACQPGVYWSDPSRVEEANSTWGCLLALGPVAFILSFVVYVGIMMGLFLWLSGPLQKFLGAFVLLAHSYGAASWCQVVLPEAVYWWALMGLFAVQAVSFSIYWHLREHRPKGYRGG